MQSTVARRTLDKGCLNRGHRRGISPSKELLPVVVEPPKTTVNR